MAEANVQIASGAASVAVDGYTIVAYNAGIGTTQLRQALVLADPNTAQNVAAVQSTAQSGGEFGLVVKNAPNNPDLLQLYTVMQSVLLEMQNLVTLLGGLPIAPSPATSTTQFQQ